MDKGEGVRKREGGREVKWRGEKGEEERVGEESLEKASLTNPSIAVHRWMQMTISFNQRSRIASKTKAAKSMT